MNATGKNISKIRKVKNNRSGGAEHGPLELLWDKHAPISLHGYLPFLSEFLNTGGVFRRFVENCPIRFTSNNAPEIADVLGTLVLSLLSGHTRYNHVQSLYGDRVAASSLGIGKIVSHDSLRRGLEKADEDSLSSWLQKELLRRYEALL